MKVTFIDLCDQISFLIRFDKGSFETVKIFRGKKDECD